MKATRKLAFLACVALATASASAIPFSITGTVGGQSVDASGTLTAGAGTVNVTLDNNQADPISIIQAISGVSFDVSGASGSGALTTVNSGNIININSDGTFTALGADPLTRWTATETGTSIYLTTLSGGAPDRLIIGPPNGSSLYASANASILGDNPSVDQTASFLITVPGVTAESIFGNPVIYFGTSADTVGVPDGGATVALLGFAVVGLGLLRRRIAVS